MDPDKLQRLRKNHITLKSTLDTDTVLDHLYSDGVFNGEHCELVRSKPSLADKNQELLNILRRTGNDGYDQFILILEKTQKHLAEDLEKTQLDQGSLIIVGLY